LNPFYTNRACPALLLSKNYLNSKFNRFYEDSVLSKNKERFWQAINPKTKKSKHAEIDKKRLLMLKIGRRIIILGNISI
jgi:hypothetical protein